MPQNNLNAGTTTNGSVTKESTEPLRDICQEGSGQMKKVGDNASVGSGREIIKGSRTRGGFILELMDELVKVGQTMGYNMDGCMKNTEDIIDSQGVDRGLVDLPLGGYSFTWSHKTANNMSKIDRFFISEAIRGVLAKGDWIEDPVKVKHEFVKHFAARFAIPSTDRIHLEMTFPRILSEDQIHELDSHVTNEEIKRAVWACGVNKSPRPDGFTFEFFQRYWSFIDRDVIDSVLFNGSPTTEFEFHKGLKQGDRLSQFLFILVMESLNLSFNRIPNAGLFSRITIGSSMQLSHLFYADDAVFVGEWKDLNLRTLVHVLRCFYLASGLRLNIHKSKLMRIGVDTGEVVRAAKVFVCSTFTTPFTYLGVMVGGSMSRLHTWDEVIRKISSRLSRWKVKTILIGGRLTLIKSILGLLPLYHMSIYKVPKGVLKLMECICRQFFNGSEGNERKMMWIFVRQESSLWSRFIKSIYGENGFLDRTIPTSRQSIWLYILKEAVILKNKGIDLMTYCRKKVGNGADTTFWDEVWIGEQPLKIQFPRMYALELRKKMSIENIADTFRRLPMGGEESKQYINIFNRMEMVQLSQMHDRWFWSLVGTGEFSVKSV
nr:RNA-directed DNA polymerase, eukaryota [Tanacetum cinerariifolium]